MIGLIELAIIAGLCYLVYFCAKRNVLNKLVCGITVAVLFIVTAVVMFTPYIEYTGWTLLPCILTLAMWVAALRLIFKKNTAEPEFVLSNRKSIYVLSYVQSILLLLPIGFLFYYLFLGVTEGTALLDIVTGSKIGDAKSYYGVTIDVGDEMRAQMRNKYLAELPFSIKMFTYTMLVCFIAYSIASALTGIAVCVAGKLNPDKVKRLFHFSFVFTAPIPIVVFLSILFFGGKNYRDTDNIFFQAIAGCLLFTALSVWGIYLLKQSKLLNKKKAEERAAIRRAEREEMTKQGIATAKEGIATAKEGLSAGAEKTKEGAKVAAEKTMNFVNEYAPIVKKYAIVAWKATVKYMKAFLPTVKNILLSPKNVWTELNTKSIAHKELFLNYLLPLVLIYSIGKYLGQWNLFKDSSWVYHFRAVYANRDFMSALLLSLGTIYITALVIHLLADKFGANKNFNQALALSAYALAPMCVAGLLYLLPPMWNIPYFGRWFLVRYLGLYSLYLFYYRLKPMMQPDENKSKAYFAVICVTCIAVHWFLSKNLW